MIRVLHMYRKHLLSITFYLMFQHIAKVHAEKKFSCNKCQKSFGKEYYRRYHEQTCGIEWKCHCGTGYSSRISLLTHARRTQHKLPDHVLFNDKVNDKLVPFYAFFYPYLLFIKNCFILS